MVYAMPELLKSFAWDAFVLFFYQQLVGKRCSQATAVEGMRSPTALAG